MSSNEEPPLDNERNPNEPEKVGPGNPPKKYRWPKGCPSPNPRGRPPSRKREDMLVPLNKHAEMILEVSNMPAGTSGHTLTGEVWRKLHAVALDPNTPPGTRLGAIKLILDIQEKAAADFEAERAEVFKNALEYKQRFEPLFREAEARGKALPKQIPHPDDVILLSSGRVRFVGPCTPGEQARMEFALMRRNDYRDGILDYGPAGRSKLRAEGIKYLKKEWRKFNRALPPRLQEPEPRPANSSATRR